MTPAEHLAEAEQLLARNGTAGFSMEPDVIVANTLVAQAHILAAIAVELGAPHPPAAGGDSNAPTATPGP